MKTYVGTVDDLGRDFITKYLLVCSEAEGIPQLGSTLVDITAESTMFRLGNLRVNPAVDRKRSQAAGPCDGWEVSEGNSQGCRPGVMNAYSRYAAMVI